MRFDLDSQNRMALLIAVLALTACGGSGSSQDASTPTVAPTEFSVTPTPTPESFAWMQPTPGRAALLGDNGGGASTATICDSADHYRDWLDSNSLSGCTQQIHGARVVIEQLVFDSAKDTAGEYKMPLAQIRSVDGSWRGYTQLQGLHPLIPKGTVVHFSRHENSTLRLDSSQQTDDGPDLGDNVTARIERYDPTSAGADLYVTIVDGAFAGRSGWMYSLYADENAGANITGFVDAVSVATPGPSVDQNSRTYVARRNLRAFKYLSECEDGMHAMENADSYKRLKVAVAAGDYHDFPKGSQLHIVADPHPDSPFLIVADDSGNQGCVGRFDLQGYAQ
jgi:hypothetical protein